MEWHYRGGHELNLGHNAHVESALLDLDSTWVVLARPGWLYFGFFLAIEFSICAQKKEKKESALLAFFFYKRHMHVT